MNRKEKLNIAKTGVLSYGVCSAILYLKEGGVSLAQDEDRYLLTMQKSLGLLDMFRFDGALEHISPFSGDFLLVLFGLTAGGMVYGWVKLTKFIDKVQEPSN